jgi:hypothetical protein
MTAPQHDRELIDKLAAMTSDEFAAVVRAARGVTDSDDVAARRRRVAEDIAKKTARMYKEN